MSSTQHRPTLFLDFDDVLCPNTPYGGLHVQRAFARPTEAPPDLFERLFSQEAVEVLNKLVEEFSPGVVLTTSWLKLLDRAHFVDLFSRSGLERASTHEKTTTWWFLFNHVVQQVFDREFIMNSLSGLVTEHKLRISMATLKRDYGSPGRVFKLDENAVADEPRRSAHHADLQSIQAFGPTPHLLSYAHEHGFRRTGGEVGWQSCLHGVYCLLDPLHHRQHVVAHAFDPSLRGNAVPVARLDAVKV